MNHTIQQVSNELCMSQIESSNLDTSPISGLTQRQWKHIGSKSWQKYDWIALCAGTTLLSPYIDLLSQKVAMVHSAHIVLTHLFAPAVFCAVLVN